MDDEEAENHRAQDLRLEFKRRGSQLAGEGKLLGTVYMLDPWWLNRLVYRELPIANADEAKPICRKMSSRTNISAPDIRWRSIRRM